MSNTDFASKAVFVPNSIYGLRAFRVSSEGDLYSPMYGDVLWGDGKNTAECDYYSSFGRLAFPGVGSHTPDINCSCGFYAFHKGQPNAYMLRENSVEAVVEGTGKALVGEKGFRVEHLTIKAVTLPPHLSQRKISGRAYGIAALAFPTLISGAAVAFTWSSTLTGLMMFLAGILGVLQTVVAGFIIHKVILHGSYALSPLSGRSITHEQIENMKERYPGVQFFTSREKMIKAFPQLNNTSSLLRSHNDS